MQHHKYSLTEINDLIPWERDIYIELLLRHLQEEQERHEKEMRRIKQGNG